MYREETERTQRPKSIRLWVQLYEYLQHLLSVMMEHIYDADTAYLDDLMPWSKNLPEICRKAT